MTILLIASFAGSLCYIVLLALYLKNWQPQALHHPDDTPFISVVIAARNEAAHIAACINSVLIQSYPQQCFEVIVIDDQSEDETADIVRQFPDVILLHTKDGASGKKHALHLGIATAKGDIIARTDADCIVSGDWLATIVAHMDTPTQLVTGPVLYKDDSTAFARFQGLDLVSLAMITASGIASRLHHLGNGANMAFRKSAFQKAGGLLQESALASGDDLFLIQRIVRQFPGSMKYLWGRQGTVFTFPCRTAGEFLAQRVRWATKNAFLPEKSVYRIWTGIWIAFLINAIAFACMLVQLSLWIVIPVLCILIIFWIEFIVLRKVAKYYGVSSLLRGFSLSAIMHYIYVLVMGCIMPFRKQYRWKGRMAE